MQIFNYFSGIHSWVTPSKTVKSSILISSTTLSIMGISMGILSKNPVLSTASCLMGATNFIAWIDLDASEELKGYKESVLKQGKEEKREGELIGSVDKRVEQIKRDLVLMQAELTQASEENAVLKGNLESSESLIKTLKSKGKETFEQIVSLERRMKVNQGLIAELTKSKASLEQEIQRASQAEKKAQETIVALMAALKKAKETIQSLQNRVSL